MESKILDKLDAIAAMKPKMAVVGSMNADYTVWTQRLPKPGETVQGSPMTVLAGGKSGNQAVTAALLGARVHMLGAVGNDSNADFLLRALTNAGVEIDAVQHVDGPSGTTVITVDAQGENTIVYSPGSNGQVDVPYIESVKSILSSSAVLGLCLESPLEAVTAAARIAHEAGVRVLFNDSPFLAQLPSDLVSNTDILLVNEHELVQLLGMEPPIDGDWDMFDWDSAQLRLCEVGFSETIVTLGGNGSVVLGWESIGDRTAASMTRIEPIRVSAIDTTGCGDSFMGTVLVGLASDLTLVDAVRLASYVSAYAATGKGAQASYGDAGAIKAKFAQYPGI